MDQATVKRKLFASAVQVAPWDKRGTHLDELEWKVSITMCCAGQVLFLKCSVTAAWLLKTWLVV